MIDVVDTGAENLTEEVDNTFSVDSVLHFRKGIDEAHHNQDASAWEGLVSQEEMDIVFVVVVGAQEAAGKDEPEEIVESDCYFFYQTSFI